LKNILEKILDPNNLRNKGLISSLKIYAILGGMKEAVLSNTLPRTLIKDKVQKNRNHDRLPLSKINKRFISNENQSIKKNLDWTCIIIYSALVIMGWLNIYSSSLSSIEDTYQKQLVFILLTIPLIFIILGIECGSFTEKYASIIFVISLLSLAGLFLFGKTIAGQRCWYELELYDSTL
jgi:hypothetical protein